MIILFILLIFAMSCLAKPLVEDFRGGQIELNEEKIRTLDILSFIKDSSTQKADRIQQVTDNFYKIILEKKEGSHINELLSHWHVIEWTLRLESKDKNQNRILLKVFISSSFPLAFYANFKYDPKSKELTLYTLRQEFGRYTPIIYDWQDFNLKSKLRYSTSILQEEYDGTIRCLQRGNYVFFMLYKNDILKKIYKCESEQLQIQMLQIGDILSFIFPYIPEEFLISEFHAMNPSKKSLNWVKTLTIGNKNNCENIKKKLSRFVVGEIVDVLGNYESSDSFAIYRLALSEIEKQMIGKTQSESPSEKQLVQFVTELKADVSGEPELLKAVENAINKRLSQEDMRRYFMINNFFKKKCETFKTEANPISATQNVTVEDFYRTHKNWAFVKMQPPFDKHYNLNELGKKEAFQTFIKSEILRLQQLGLQDFVKGETPVTIEFYVEEKPTVIPPQQPAISRLMTAEDARKMLDGGANCVFSDEELLELLAEPDPAKFKVPADLGMAYDWAGKFMEAKAELEKDTTPWGRFELGRFLMAGRPGIPADRGRANVILEKLANDLEEREDELTAGECLLAGKVCHEIQPLKSTQWAHWIELGDDFFQRAIELGEPAGYYYIQYYRRMKPGKKPEEMWKALLTQDLEARAGLAAYAGHIPQFRRYLNQEQHLHDLKAAVLTCCNRAQYWLGLLYSLNVGTHPGKYLKYNPDKARFWLMRAAERGDRDAQFLLGSMQ